MVEPLLASGAAVDAETEVRGWGGADRAGLGGSTQLCVSSLFSCIVLLQSCLKPASRISMCIGNVTTAWAWQRDRFLCKSSERDVNQPFVCFVERQRCAWSGSWSSRGRFPESAGIYLFRRQSTQQVFDIYSKFTWHRFWVSTSHCPTLFPIFLTQKQAVHTCSTPCCHDRATPDTIRTSESTPRSSHRRNAGRDASEERCSPHTY